MDERIISEATDTEQANAGVATQVANPTRTVLRTIVQTFITLVPIVNAVAVALVAYLNEQTDLTIPGTVFIVLNAIIAGTAFAIGLVNRIFLVPGVEAWLNKNIPALAALRK